MRQHIDYSAPLDSLPVGRIKSHFLDSGSFTFWTKAAEYGKVHRCKPARYYDTKEYQAGIEDYMDGYAAFIKRYEAGIDLYANVDVIPVPGLTWHNQRYLEINHALSPVPVVHYGTDLNWLRLYMEKGYPLIGLGGLVGSTGTADCIRWLDRAFELVCSGADRLPMVKIHGFGVTAYDILVRYPWWSVDSSSWTKIAAFGGILVPHKRNSGFVFDEHPYIVNFSSDLAPNKAHNFFTWSPKQQNTVRDWLDLIEVPLGRFDKEGKAITFGVSTRHTERRAANLMFFERFRRQLPPYPWSFASGKRGVSLGGQNLATKAGHKPRPMIVYYSGEGAKANPEITLQDDAALMLTYVDFCARGRPTPRFKRVLQVRRQSAKVGGQM
jgi:hypothetical protein